jgi:hypothetical protein
MVERNAASGSWGKVESSTAGLRALVDGDIVVPLAPARLPR